MADIPTEGSVEKPFRENPPRRLIEVHWSGGLFISGAARYSYIDTTIRLLATAALPRWEPLGMGAFTDGEIMGSAVGGGVFVLVGAANSGTTHSQGVIMASRDGREWEQVYVGLNPDDSDTSTGSVVFGAVWDGKNFWAGAHESHNPGRDMDPYEIDILLSSNDGFSWAEAGRRVIPFAEWSSPGYPTGLLEAHCAEAVRDSNGNRVPDGIYGHKGALLIRPSTVQRINYLFGNPIADASFEPRVVINDRTTIDVGIPVACVGYAGGAWLAGGGSYTAGASAQSAYSTDDGLTWMKLDTPGLSAFLCTISGR